MQTAYENYTLNLIHINVEFLFRLLYFWHVDHFSQSCFVSMQANEYPVLMLLSMIDKNPRC